MARRKIDNYSNCPYHISGRCINKESFPIPTGEVWKIMEEQLFFIHYAYGIKIHAFVLMDNHFHLLASDPQSLLSCAMRHLMKETSRNVNQLSQRVNQLWGGRFFRSLLQTNHYFLHAYKYTLRNPAEAGLCQNVLDYPYSSLQGLLGLSHILFPIDDYTLFEMDPSICIQWLDQNVKAEDWDAVAKALKKGKFKLRKTGNGKKSSELEKKLL